VYLLYKLSESLYSESGKFKKAKQSFQKMGGYSMKAVEEVYAFVQDAVKKTGAFYLATQDGDQPRVRPFGAIDLIDGKLYIQTGRKKDVFQQMMKNPKVEICACADDKWIRIAAVVVDDDRVEVKKKVLDDIPVLRDIGYSEHDENTKVLYLKNATATFFSFTGAPRTVRF